MRKHEKRHIKHGDGYDVYELDANRYQLIIGGEAAQASSRASVLAANERVTSIVDTYVKKNSTTNNSSSTTNWICSNSSNGTRYSFVKVSNLPELGSDCMVTSAK